MSQNIVKQENIYTSIACNRTVEAADWGNNGLIIYGASNAVALFNPQYTNGNGKSAKIIHTYVRHTKRVNTVRWLRATPTESESLFISGSDDATAVVWNISDRNNPQSFALKGHESGVNAVSGLKCPRSGEALDGEWLLATAAADCTLKVWRFAGSGHVECTQTVLLNGGFCFTLRLVQLPKTEQILLAFSSDDETISLWVQQQPAEPATQGLFQPVHKLTGHEDWVRCLDFAVDGDGDLLLASCSQDNFIRLWRIAPRTAEEVRNNAVDLLNLMDGGAKAGEIRVEEKILQLGESTWFAVSLESVLYGHEGWVYGVHWHQSPEQGLRLLSASIDKTLIVWAPNKECAVWMESVRVGGVGGNSLGFFGARFSSDGRSIFGHSYQGGLHIWQQSLEDAAIWTPSVIVSGHFGEVRDLAWEPQGQYLMTVSADQTTRVHAPWQPYGTWHELARPQVHGYDMQALALLSRYKFASGAEEKIVRTFQAPANFIENFRQLVGVQDQADDEGNALLESLPKGASVPSLGLSNKAVYNVETPSASEVKHVKDEYPENYFVPVTLETPPQEEMLMQNSLWPEVQKLYGHGFEIYALAASPDGRLLASSCRATNAEHAQIILWNTTTWKQIQKLPAHQLTVTQMRFSPNGRYLLSVSRDRRWALFERDSEGQESATFQLSASADKTNGVHGRIIWTCDWSHDSKCFATASRDGKAVIWTRSEGANADDTSSLKGWHAAAVLEQKNASITALAFAPNSIAGDCNYIVALGYESGCIRLYRFDGRWTELLSLSNDQSHHSTVKRLQFRPQPAVDLDNTLCLASCGEDHLVRVYKFNL